MALDHATAGPPGTPRRVVGGLAIVALGLLFAVCATMNSGGYQFGTSDQAFYIPAVLRHLAPSLFPRDGVVIDAEDRLLVFTRALAAVAAATGASLPSVFLAGYLLSLGVLLAGIWLVGRRLFTDRLAIAALALAWTLRHRIARTGANTLEGYFHPRQLAFAIGLTAVAAVLRGRSWLAALLVVAVGLVHPTTGAWFAIWIGVAVVLSDRRARWPFLAAGAAAALLAAWVIWLGPFRPRLARIDTDWLQLLLLKDYLFPTAWPAFAWLTNLAYPVVIVGVFLYRRRLGLADRREAGLVAGCLALVAVFAASLPFVAARVALAVQLQVPRVFWMADALATVYVVWLLAERPGASAAARRRAARMVFVVMTAAALGRGLYVMRVEHPERVLARVGLAPTPWHDATGWIRAHTAPDAQVLADPGHAWRYGTSVRVSARRDVLVEDVKDAAVAIYSREIAMRVLDRIGALSGFDRLTPAEVRALAARYDLSVLVTERDLDLPLAYRNERFKVYWIAGP